MAVEKEKSQKTYKTQELIMKSGRKGKGRRGGKKGKLLLGPDAGLLVAQSGGGGSRRGKGKGPAGSEVRQCRRKKGERERGVKKEGGTNN